MEGLNGPSMSASIYYVVLACPRCPGCSVPGRVGHVGLDAQAAPPHPPQSMQPVASVLASRVKTYDREPSTTTTTTIITHSRQRSQASESTDYTQNLPPSKKDTTSLKHTESVRIAIVTRYPTDSTSEEQWKTGEERAGSVRGAYAYQFFSVR